MKINKVELLEALEVVKPGLARRENIEQTTSFGFMGDRVVTYNDEISISHPIDQLNITGAIKANALYDFLAKVKQEEITMTVEENQIKIQAGRSKAGLVFEQEMRLPVDEIQKVKEWHELPKNFTDGLKLAYPCCSKDYSRPIMTCVFVKDDLIVSTDSYQLVKYTLDGQATSDKVLSRGFLLPATAARVLSTYPITHVAESGGMGHWVHFKTAGGTIFSSRTLGHQYVNFGALFGFEGVEIVFPDTAVASLEKASIFAGGNSQGSLPLVEVTIADNQIKFRSQNETGWFEEVLETEFEDTPLTFQTDVTFLHEVIKRSPKCEYDAMKIKFAGENWEHVVVAFKPN